MKKTNKKATNKLASIRKDAIRGGVIREIVIRRMLELGWSSYKLAQKVDGKVAAPSVYDYVKGRTDMPGARIAHILSALGLKISPASDTTPDNIRRPRKSSKTR